MEKENASLEFRFKKIGETRNYYLEEIWHNELISKKHKKTCKTVNYVEHILILASTITPENSKIKKSKTKIPAKINMFDIIKKQ